MRRERDYYPWVARPAYVDLATAVTRYPTIPVITLMGYFDFSFALSTDRIRSRPHAFAAAVRRELDATALW